MMDIVKHKKIIVVNTHNHPEQTGGNFQFSTTGRNGLAHMVEDLCASGNDMYYTKLMNNTNWQWEVNTYKVTRWLSDGEMIFLGDREKSHNVVEDLETIMCDKALLFLHSNKFNPSNIQCVLADNLMHRSELVRPWLASAFESSCLVIFSSSVIWTPGHTPDSLILWFAHENRLFIGDQFYRFEDIMLTYNHTDIKDYEASLKKILNFIMKQPQPKQIRYSASRSDSDFLCLPILKQYHRFFLSILAGTQIGSPLQVNEGDGWRYENRDKSMRVIISSDIVERLNRAREKALQYH